MIFVGQGLIIPVRIVPATETPSATPVVVVVTATPVTSDNTETNEPTASGNTYTVQRGDNLSSIARRFNTTIGALVQLNGIANPNRILAGQVLNIPATGGSVEATPTSPPAATAVPTEADDTEEQDNTGIIPPETDDAPTTYVVQPGDNLYRIALRNGISLAALAEANNITNFNLIFIGQELTIP